MIKRKSSTLTPKNQASRQCNSQMHSEDKRAVLLSTDGSVQSEHIETQYLENIHKDEFFVLCDDFRININSLFSRMLTLREKHRFNIFLRTIKDNHGIRIMDSLIYIEEKYARFNQLLKCLDQENEYLIKVEASEINTKHKLPNTHLKDFLEFEKK